MALSTLKGQDWQTLWLKAVLFQDTLVGRDKCMRFAQYCARCLSGLIDSSVAQQVLVNLAMARKALRFGRQVRWAHDMREVYLNERDPFNLVTTLLEMGSFLVYCCIDHACFAQRVNLLPLGPKKTDLLDRFAEVFWVTEVVPALMREVRAYFNGGGAKENSQAWIDRRARAKLLIFKLLCDLPCSYYFVQPLAWRNKRVHKAWCGALGAAASAVSIQMTWPRSVSLEK
mmetsp:Transcript_1064/g.2745  ORF Transcript_1064/g.2745 Transcript_1064/m.2745 type:complete len:229 (+) Transcript_1064:72-758(+)